MDFYGGGGGDAYLSVSYNVFVFFCFFVSVIRERPYCLNKKSFILVFLFVLNTCLLLCSMAHSLRECFRFCFALLRCTRRAAASTRTSFCLVWCAPSVGEHSELCFLAGILNSAGSTAAAAASRDEPVPQPRRNRQLLLLADLRRKYPPVDSTAC